MYVHVANVQSVVKIFAEKTLCLEGNSPILKNSRNKKTDPLFFVFRIYENFDYENWNVLYNFKIEELR